MSDDETYDDGCQQDDTSQQDDTNQQQQDDPSTGSGQDEGEDYECSDDDEAREERGGTSQGEDQGIQEVQPNFERYCAAHLQRSELPPSDPSIAKIVKSCRCEYSYIKAYTSQALYKQVNAALRDDTDDLEGMGVYVWMCREQIRAVASVKGWFTGTVWRGVPDFSIDDFVNRVGQSAYYPSFTSTSLSRRLADDWRKDGVLFEMEVSSGCGAEVAEYSFFPNEQEVLMRPYCQFTITNVDEDSRTVWLNLTPP